jgi:hypothetical protein
MEQLLRHYKKEHKDGMVKKQDIVLPPYEFAWVNFDMLRTADFRKTLRHFFVCYADFECSNIPVQDPSSKRTKILMKQIPNSFMVFFPDLMFLTDHRTKSRELFKEFSH